MHSKAFHRILGLIVLFAIVLLILPFWDGEDELSFNERVVRPPAFPDQPVHETIIPVKAKKETPSVKSKPGPSSPASSVDLSVFDEDLAKIVTKELRDIQSTPVTASKTVSHFTTVNKYKIQTEKPFLSKSKITPEKKIDTMAWSVQIEGFSKKADALNFVNRLRREGQRAYLQSVMYAKTAEIHVWIGPITDYRHAENLAKQVQRTFQLKAYVMRESSERS